MSYVGRGIENLADRVVLDALTASATADYTLQLNSTNFIPSSASALTVSLNGVIQKPESSYTVAGAVLSFSSALSSSDSIDFIIADRDITLQTPSAGSVGASQVAAGIITGQTALASEPADTDEFLVSDAGTLKRIDYSLIKAASGLTKLASTEISSSTAAIIFDSSVVTAYDNYLIILNGIKTVSNTASGGIMFSTDNGSSFVGRSKFTADFKDLSAGSVGGAHTGTFSLNSVTNPVMYDNHSTKPLSGYFFFHNCNPLNDSDQNPAHTNHQGNNICYFFVHIFLFLIQHQQNQHHLLIVYPVPYYH